MLFDRQYILTEDVVVETRYRTETDTWTDEDGNSHTDTYQVPYDYYICTVTLENFDLSHVPVYVLSLIHISWTDTGLSAGQTGPPGLYPWRLRFSSLCFSITSSFPAPGPTKGA